MRLPSILAQAPTASNTDDINRVLEGTLTILSDNFAAVQETSHEILLSLIIIETLIFLIYSLAAGSFAEIGKGLLEKAVLFGFVMFLTFNWGAIAGAVRGYVVGAGGEAGGDAGAATAGYHPGAIAESGVRKVAVIFNPEARDEISDAFLGDKQRQKPPAPVKDDDDSWTDAFVPDTDSMMTQLGEGVEEVALRMVALFIFTLLALMIVFVHFYVALQAFVITVEFYIIVTITSCFVPFAVNKHFSYLATGAINAVIGSSVKLGVLTMILAMMGDPIADLALSTSPDMYEMLSLLLSTATLAFLVSKAPQIAQAAFTGGGSGVDVGSALSAVGAAAATAATGGTMAVGQGVAAAASKASPYAAQAGRSAVNALREADMPSSLRGSSSGAPGGGGQPSSGAPGGAGQPSSGAPGGRAVSSAGTQSSHGGAGQPSRDQGAQARPPSQGAQAPAQAGQPDAPESPSESSHKVDSFVAVGAWQKQYPSVKGPELGQEGPPSESTNPPQDGEDQ